jgi:hypothetical protein
MAVSYKLNSVLIQFFHLFKSHAVLFGFEFQRKRHFLHELLPEDMNSRVQFTDVISDMAGRQSPHLENHILWDLPINTKNI